MPVKELMQKLSCTNPEPKKNKLYEIVELGNGKWSKGLVISVCIPLHPPLFFMIV